MTTMNQEWKQAYKKAKPSDRMRIRLLFYQVLLQTVITLGLVWLAL